jgi:hypothetical protein
MGYFSITFSLALIAVAGALPATAREGEAGSANLSRKQAVSRSVERCEKIQENIAKQAERSKRLEGAHRQQYERLIARVGSLVTRAQEAGFDTADLEAKAAALQLKVDKFNLDKQTYLNSLRQTQTFTCDKTEDEFRASLRNSREDMKLLHSDVRDIHNFVQNELKPAVRSLRKELAPSPSSSPEAGQN